MIVKKMGLREVFIMSAILDKMDLKADTGMILNNSKVKKVESVSDVTSLGKEVMVSLGIDIVTKIMKGLYKAEDEVVKLIKSLTGKTNDEIENMGFDDIKEFFVELSKQQGFDDFLKQAGVSTEQK